LVGSPRVNVVGAPQVDRQPMIVGAARLLSAAKLRGAAAFAGGPRLSGQPLDAGALIFRKALHGQASSRVCAPFIVIRDTMVGQAVVPLVGGKERCTGR